MTTKGQYRLELHWSDAEAAHYYTLQKYNRYSKNHSCYVCFDDWGWARRKCHNNRDKWIDINHGDKMWALRIAKHYDLNMEAIPQV